MMDDKPKARPKPTRRLNLEVPEPPPELFIRTPEQIAADKAELAAELERMKAADAGGGDSMDPDGEQALAELQHAVTELRAAAHAKPVPSAAEKLRELGLDRWQERSIAWQAERRALPCWSGVYPAGAPDGFSAEPADQSTAQRGRAFCVAAGARDACKYKHEPITCLWERTAALYDEARERMTLAKVENDEFKLVLAAADPEKPVALKPYDPLQLVRRWIAGGRAEVKLEDAAELAPLTGAVETPQLARFSGDERLVIFGGNPGRGKTVAGAYAIARLGGLYVLEYELRRPYFKPKNGEPSQGIDPERASTVPGVLVIDQLQPLDPDEKKRAAQRLDEIVHRRFAKRLRTLLIGNIDYLTFARRYGSVEGDKVKHPGVICERCSQAGLFVLFGGPSLRAEVIA